MMRALYLSLTLVLVGSMASIPAAGPAEVSAGMQRADSRPASSVLAAPTPLLPQADAALRTYRFTWSAVSGAQRYRMEIAEDASFRKVLYAEESSTTTLRRPNRTLPLGTIFWRVSAIGEYGQSGPPSAPVPIRIVP